MYYLIVSPTSLLCVLVKVKHYFGRIEVKLQFSCSSAAVQHAVRSQDSVYHTLYIHIIVINSLAVPPAADVIVP